VFPLYLGRESAENPGCTACCSGESLPCFIIAHHIYLTLCLIFLAKSAWVDIYISIGLSLLCIRETAGIEIPKTTKLLDKQTVDI
jgi:hypothetical protein